MLVFCTTCKNRVGHLRRTLPKNLSDNPRSKFIVLDYGSEDDLLDWLTNEMSMPIIAGNLIVYSCREQPRFRMAPAKNMAHRLGMIEGGDVLVNLDADNYAGERFENFAEEQFALKPGVFLWSRMVKGEMTRGISGRIAVSAEAFRRVGGYDEVKYAEWGADDKDFNLRLQAIACEPIEIPRRFLESIPHSARMRFKEYPHLAGVTYEHFKLEKADISSAVANGGRVGLGRVFRNFNESRPIDIPALTTRIFGIGLHKTATTSLHRALEILGYRSWHWNSAHSAKAIWREMNTLGYSRTLERFDALTDLPIPLLYEKLDLAYPGSKFILTTRDLEPWLDAVRRHYSYDHNRFREAWDSDPFTHQVHRALYGTTKFEARRMGERAARHAAEVREYFRDRPSDLYVGELGWPGLCRFLGVDEPSVPFPRVYVQNHAPERVGAKESVVP